ncbi:BTAD domain-containing putative transcriptional regulator [Kitasatospora sp. NPDC001119]
MHFRLLGNLEVATGRSGSILLPPKLRTILAMLLISEARTVPVDRLIDELWLDRPPTTAMATIQTYIYQLRKALNGGKQIEGDAIALVTDTSGYALITPPETVDAHAFQSHFEEGRRKLEAENYRQAASELNQALSLWRSSVLADVPKGPLLESYSVRLEEARLQATELYFEARIGLGQYRDVIPELKALTVSDPLNEGIHARLMIALHHAGRRHEALDVYGRLRSALKSDLGLEPSAPVQQLHLALLSGDLTIEQPLSGPPDRAVARTIPTQLPPDISDFTGREAILSQIDRALFPIDGDTAPKVVSVTGMPGVGKSALIVHLAHRLRRRFPDGQFFACLTGASLSGECTPTEPFSILGGFLQAIGFAQDQIPGELDSRITLFRNWCADRRALFVLDDSDSEAQVRPLIPSGADCAVLISSHAPLHGLSGSRSFELEPLTADDAVELLSRVSGQRWSQDDRAIARTVAKLCDYLPITVRAIGSRLMMPQRMSLNGAAIRLADCRRRMATIVSGDMNLWTRLERSYRRLQDHDRQALLNLSASGRPKFLASEAAALLDLKLVTVESLLERLHDARFLVPSASDDGSEISYRLMETVRLFLLERREEEHRAAAFGDSVARNAPLCRVSLRK